MLPLGILVNYSKSPGMSAKLLKTGENSKAKTRDGDDATFSLYICLHYIQPPGSPIFEPASSVDPVDEK